MRTDTNQSQSRLISSWGYKNISVEEKAEICNGAGAAGQWISSLIPNTMYGLDCIEAFNIHDYDYTVGVSREDKDRADNNLLTNLLTLINRRGGLLKLLRTNRALKYYEAVNLFGDDAFFKGKKPEITHGTARKHQQFTVETELFDQRLSGGGRLDDVYRPSHLDCRRGAGTVDLDD